MRAVTLALLAAACSSKSAPASTAASAGPLETPPAATPAAATAAAPAKGKGKVLTETFKSKALGVDKTYLVYLPAGYDAEPTTRWPVFYYLHGLTGNERNWLEGGKLDAAADELGLEAIVVMPDGDDGFYVDGVDRVDYDACMKDGTGLFAPGQQSRQHTCVRKRDYSTYITKDLVAEIDAKYRTIATREGRAIAGLSMGGFGALQLSMRHPELYAAAASHSGVDALLYGGPYPYQAGKVELISDVKQWGASIPELGKWMRSLFGADIARWRAHDPAALVAKLEPGKPALYLDCGTEDVFMLHNGAQYIHDLLAARKIEHGWYLGPGRHDFTFWRVRLPESLKFLRERVAKPQR